MRSSELLTALATWLASPNNEAMQLADEDEATLEATARACITAAIILRGGAEELIHLEPAVENTLTPEKLDHLNQVVSALDGSDNADLKKAASVIDELLLTLSADPAWVSQHKQAQEKKIDEMKVKYEDVNKQLHRKNKTEESAKKIDASPMFQEAEIRDRPLSTRSCPDHPGGQLARVGDHEWQCQLDHKIYNWLTGFTDLKGRKVPGGDPSHQFDQPHNMGRPIFDTREDRTQSYTSGKR